MAKAQRRSSLGSQGDPGRENTASSVLLDEDNRLDGDKNNEYEYGDDIFEIEDESPSRPSTGDDGLGRNKEKGAHDASKDATLLALGAGPDSEFQVYYWCIHQIHTRTLLPSVPSCFIQAAAHTDYIRMPSYRHNKGDGRVNCNNTSIPIVQHTCLNRLCRVCPTHVLVGLMGMICAQRSNNRHACMRCMCVRLCMCSTTQQHGAHLIIGLRVVLCTFGLQTGSSVD